MSSNALRGICSFILFTAIVATAIFPTPHHPAFSQNPTPQAIESDDMRVIRTGNWSSQSANAASGSSYLYGGGGENDTLALDFYGPSIEVIYVSGPKLGTLAIEVDDTVLRTVITAADHTQYGQSSKINYLSHEWHTLKVYAQEAGTVAIDAFVAVLDGPSKSSTASESNLHTPRFAANSHLLINELGQGPTDGSYKVELFNPTSNAVNLNNWVLRFYTGSGSSSQTLPAFTLQPGGYVVAALAQGTNTDTIIYLNYVYDINFNQNKAIALINNNGQGVDFVRWGGSTVTPLAPDTWSGNLPVYPIGSSQSVGRDQNDDDNNAGDWTSQCATLGGQNNSCLMLNEFYTGGVDALEIYNGSRYSVNLQAYGTVIYGTGTTTNGTFTFPSYTIPPGGYVILQEGTGTNSGNLFYAGFNFVWESTYGGARLRDAALVSLDVAQWGTTTAVTGDAGWSTGSIPSAPSSTSSVARRASSLDSNRPSDFCAQTPTIGGVNNSCVVINEVAASEPAWVELYNASLASYTLSFGYLAFYTGNILTFQYQFPTFTLAAGGYVRIIEGAGTNTATTLYTGAGNLLTWGTNSDGAVFLTDSTNNGLDVMRFGTSQTVGGNGAAFTSPNAPSFDLFTDQRSIGRSSSSRDFDNGSDWCRQAITAGARNYGCNSRIAVFAPGTAQVSLVDGITNPPAPVTYNTYSSNLPAGGLNGQWVMGDWNGDGRETPGVYGTNGVFYYTNTLGPIRNSDWLGIWFGLLGGVVPNAPIAGRFNSAVQNDCIGVTDSGNFPPYGVAFVMYFTCDMTGGNPGKSFQWLSVLLPDNQGFTGTFQFGAGNYDGNGVDSIAVQRGNFIAFTMTDPTTLAAAFPYAQYFSAPEASNSNFLVGDFDNDGLDSFGMYFPLTGNAYWKNDLDWNSGSPVSSMAVGIPIGTSTSAAAWRGY